MRDILWTPPLGQSTQRLDLSRMLGMYDPYPTTFNEAYLPLMLRLGRSLSGLQRWHHHHLITLLTKTKRNPLQCSGVADSPETYIERRH